MTDQLDFNQFCRRLDRTVTTYDAHAAAQREIAKRVLARLDYIRLTPQSILDLTIHPSDCIDALRSRYPSAWCLSACVSESILMNQPKRWFKRSPSVCVLDCRLPFASNAFDFVFMNLTLAWVNDWRALLHECYRVLRPNGMLLFSTVGPDTLIELRNASLQSSLTHCIHPFVDMHDIGDGCLQAGFVDPVMDVSPFVLQYPHLDLLFDDLRMTGCTNVLTSRAKGLTTPRRWAQLQMAYRAQEELFPVTIEAVVGHAWVGDKQPKSSPSEFVVSVDQLRDS